MTGRSEHQSGVSSVWPLIRDSSSPLRQLPRMHLSSCRSAAATVSRSLTDCSHCRRRFEIWNTGACFTCALHHEFRHMHRTTRTCSRAICVSPNSLWQRVFAIFMLHNSLSSLTAWPSNTAFQWWLKFNTYKFFRQLEECVYECVPGLTIVFVVVTAVWELSSTSSWDHHQTQSGCWYKKGQKVKRKIAGLILQDKKVEAVTNILGKKREKISYWRKLFSLRNLSFCSKLWSPLKTPLMRSGEKYGHFRTVTAILQWNILLCVHQVRHSSFRMGSKKELNLNTLSNLKFRIIV